MTEVYLDNKSWTELLHTYIIAEEPMTRPQSAQDELSESDQTREESATPARRYPRRLNRKEPDRYCDTYMNK